MTTPTIGFTDSSDVRIDFATFLERRLLIQAASGAGKSTLMRGFIEQLAGVKPQPVQQWIVDREGDLVTLREAGDFVLVGKGGDVPADRKTVKVLARRLMELGASAIFDLSELRIPEQREYVKLLFDELTHMPRALWHPLVVWLDEGHMFAPEKESAVSLSAVVDAASLWRKRGYCLALATQRLSKLDKDVAAELHNKLIGYTDDVDVKRAGDQLGMTTEQRASLQLLEPGQFYARGPAISRASLLVRAPVPTTVPPPKGEARAVAPPAPEKVRAILGKLADLARESEEELRTVDELRKAIAERERTIRQLQKGGAERVVETTITVVDQAAIERAVTSERRRWLREFSLVESRAAKVRQAGEAVLEATGTLALEAKRLRDATGVAVSAPMELRDDPVDAGFVHRTSNAPPAAPVRRETDSTTRPPTGSLSASEQKIIDALGAFAALGMDEVARGNAAVFAGYRTGGRFNNLTGALRTSGLIDYPRDGYLALTAEGRAAVQATLRINTLDDLHAAWRGKLDASQVKLFDTLLSVYPDPISREQLAEETGYAVGGRFNNVVGSLRSLGIADYPTKGDVIATKLLFPEELK